MTDLHGNEPIVFDFGSAGSLVTAARTAASAIRGQRGSRNSWVTQAEQDFSGFFAQLFRENALTAASDAGQLAVALDGLATITSSLVDQAHAENERRKTAREWYEARENRDTLDKIGDFFTGEDAPPSGPQPPPPVEPADVPPNRERRTSGRGPNGGTSSARPANLRTFAQSSSAADDELSPHQLRVTSLANTFNANTEWGQIDARGLVHAFQLWLAANENDARWARTLAAAFEEAGGSGAVSTLSNAGLAAALQAADVDATRDDLDITMPEALGFQPTTGYSLDPVNTATGNFIEDELDLALAGPAQLELTRMYNSVTTDEGAFGHGWCSLADAGLAFDDEQATFTRADGRVLLFPRLGDGWDRGQGANLWLSRVGEGYRIADNQGAWWAMDALGRPTGQGSGPGTTVTLTRDGDRLVEIADERGRCIRLHWEDRHGGRVVAAESSDGRTATYDYDTHGHLVAVTTAAGTRSYGWDVEQHLVVTVTDADGVVEADNVYDAQRRVRTQLTQHGRRVRFSYLPGRVTVVDDEDGTRSNTWIADRSGRLVGVVDAHDERQSTAYDTHGNVIMVVERDGSTTVHEYDERGRRARTVSPSGTELTFHHDEADRLVAVITGDGALTEASYVGDDRDPSRIVDAEGGVAELTWDRGLLTRVVGPTGVTVLREHDAAGNLVALTDGDGHTSRFEHDAAGNVVAATTPLGHRTTYAYDAAGRLVSRTAPDGATWTYEHTPGGRLSVVVDPTGGRTTVEHGQHGERSLTTDPLGRTTRHDHDVLGNPAAVVLPDGTRWEYTHDALSRLTTVTSPDGGRWTTGYDAVGSPTSVTDPAGVTSTGSYDRGRGQFLLARGDAVTQLRVDERGRLIGGITPDGAETVFSYDRCGRVVESVDAEGGLTRFTYDAAGNLVTRVAPSGSTVAFEYDGCGRVVAATDPTGGRTTHTYDPDGRLVRVTHPNGETSYATYDECGRVVEASAPGTGTRRWTYDRAGRPLTVHDEAHGTRRFVRDAAGQLLEVVDGNGGVTRYTYDLLGRAVGVTDPEGGVTRREFDTLGRCTAETDPLGRTTRAGYDEAGRLQWQEDPTGQRTTWSYDDAGRVTSVSVDGVVQREVALDLRGRRATITDHTDPRGTRCHVLRWNGRHQLVARSRDGREVTWTYDADGRRTSMTTPDGSTTTYGRDPVGRVVSVDHPLLGRVDLDLDAVGRPLAARAGDLTQSWERRDGFVVAHATTGPAGTTRTSVDRDEHGRIRALTRDGETSRFDHDAAGQLVAARCGDSVTSWRYDRAGRLVAESRDGEVVEHVHDAAGQLVRSSRGDATTSHTYDALGRRTSSSSEAGTTTYDWSPMGWLSAVTTGRGRTEVHVDALGELAAVDGTEIFRDTASWAGGAVLVGDVPVVAAGPVTGVASQWTTPGWRPARPMSPEDPWALSGANGALPGLPDGLDIGPGGELVFGGLEWMGARAYDPASRGFLSVDPLAPVTGAGWSGNPYSYAGNDPLHALDPLGLRPATDADLEVWARQHNGIADEALAVGMVVAGAALMFAGPVGVVAGAALISGGVNAYSQFRSGEKFNGVEFAVAVGVGALTGGIGVGTGAALAAGQIGRGTAMAITMGTGGTTNAGQYTATQLVRGEDVNLGHAGVAFATGAAGGPLGAGAGRAGSTLATRTGHEALEGITTHGVNVVGSTGLDMANDYAQTGQVDPIKSLLAGGGNVHGGNRATHEGALLVDPGPAPSADHVPGQYHDYAAHYNEQQAINRLENQRAGLE
jgi:RHS repeat-associated protein